MSLLIDKQFVSLLSPRLERFTQKNDYIWNFRCPVCGDSKKNKLKCRGYIYRRKSGLFYSCHNCSLSISFGSLLKALDKSLYNEYIMERFKDESAGNVPKPSFDEFKMHSSIREKFSSNIIDLPKISSLNDDHLAKKFLINRQIPNEKFSILYFAENFKSFVHSLLPNKSAELVDNDPRIIIPFYDEKNIIIGFQGRAISSSKIRYITIKLQEDSRKIYGLNHLDLTKKIYVVEGPFDSMFLKNSIAMMDAALYNAAFLGNYDFVFVYDNENRNKQVVNNMEKTIKLGKNICIWPKNIKEKDINDMVLSGLTGPMVQSIIDNSTYSGLKAKMNMVNWSKV